MNIVNLIKGKERIEESIDCAIHYFLTKFNSVGGYAPTVSDLGWGGGRDTIEKVEVDGINIVLFCNNWFRNEATPFQVSFPASLIDSMDMNALKAFAEEQKKQKKMLKKNKRLKKKMKRKPET